MKQTLNTLLIILDLIAVLIFIKQFYLRKDRPGIGKKILITLCLTAFWFSWSDLFLQLSLAYSDSFVAWLFDFLEPLGGWGMIAAILWLDNKYGQKKLTNMPFIFLLSVFPILSFFWYFGYKMYMDPSWSDHQYDNLANHIGIFSWITILLLNALLCFLYYAILEVQTERIESALLSQQYEAERRHYEDVEEMQRVVRGLSHDMNNMLSTADLMLQKQQYAELHQLLQGAVSRCTAPRQLLNTGNPALDNIVSLKLTKAHTLHIPFKTDIDIPGHLNLNFEAMATIFGNLLDNAIEAQEPLEPDQREIHLKLKYMDQMLIAAVSNRCLPQDDSRSLLQTTKNDTESHGFGTSNVKQSIAKLGGTIHFYRKENWFHVDFLLYEMLPSKNDK